METRFTRTGQPRENYALGDPGGMTRTGRPRFDTSLGDPITDLLQQVAEVAGQVQSGAQIAAGGGYQTVSFVTKYKVPLAVTAGLLLGIFTGPSIMRAVGHRR